MLCRLWTLLAIALLLPALPGHAEDRLLAVLELQSKLPAAEAKSVDAGYLTNVIRSSALEALPGLRVMTRENMLVLVQASGKSLADCEGECEVDTGRRLGADLVVSGELLKFGSRYKLDLRLHDTHEGRLLSGAQASGRSIDELDEATGAAVKKLFAALPAAASKSAPELAHAASGPTSFAASPTLARILELRAEAIRNAVFLERKKCHELDAARSLPLLDATAVARLCSRFGNVFSLELFDPPHLVEASADSDTSASYPVQVGCQVFCLCAPTAQCVVAEPIYLGMAGEPVAPNLNRATVQADYQQVTYRDEAHGIYDLTAKMCSFKAPVADKIKSACANPASPRDEDKLAILAGGESITVVGETSGALIPLGCEFHCPCDASGRCSVEMKPIGFNATTFEDAAQLKRAPPTLLRAARSNALPDDFSYVSIPAHLYPVEGK